MARPAGTRAALLDAALDAFAARGYAGASIREITGVVGVRESAFYAHFPSKRAIYDELFAVAGPPVAARALDAVAENRPPAEFLPGFATTLVDSWSTPQARKFAAMMMRDAFDSEAQGWRTLRASVDGVLSLLNERFAHWQSAGYVRDDVPPETIAFEFITAIVMTRFIYFNIAAGRADGTRGYQVVKSHVETFLTLVQPRPAKEKRA
ncbi:MAG TPA: TetR/AcrR family transcriptional regulator [Candidatus Elarobacter sp.]|jgi:AcrR family transcriptional regulator|nr:TetR/AcrR family transcriptional regulator [Candidatus Elarobacter sp.]